MINEKAISIANSRKLDILRLTSANQEKIRLWAKLEMDEALAISLADIKKITSVNDVKVLNLTAEEFHDIKKAHFNLVVPESVDDKLPYYFVFGLEDLSKPTLSATLIIPFIVFIFVFILLYSSIHFIIKKVFRPLSEMISYDNQPNSTKTLLDIEADGEIKLILEKIRDSQQEKIRSEAEISNVRLATQLAHDIRSPLEALKSLKEEMSSLPELSRKRAQLIINRIEEITYNLLKTYKNSSQNCGIRTEELLGLVSSVMIEKQIEYRSHEIEFKEEHSSNAYGLFSKISRNTLKCIISNFVNNGIESLNGDRGSIIISLSSKDDMNVITISDNGSGIPVEIRDNLFAKGYTTKKNGNGLGLFGAKNEIEAVGGRIEFTSQIGKGTDFVISLPKSETPDTFLEYINISDHDKIIVLDDDPAFHEVWDSRFVGHRSKVEHFYSINEILTKYSVLPKSILLLSDFDLMGQMDGIELILKLHHSSKSVLVTARSEESAIQERCLKSGIKLLPKPLVNYVKIINESQNTKETSRQSDQNIKVVLIDDDKFIHFNWSTYCQKHDLTFVGFKSVESFLAKTSNIDKNAHIFIDSNLDNELKGEVESEKIFKNGFINLYLATGYERESFAKPSWIKEIYSKSPNDIFRHLH